ncbi:MAG: PAS domain S-box protein [Bacteroidales bacterium]
MKKQNNIKTDSVFFENSSSNHMNQNGEWYQSLFQSNHTVMLLIDPESGEIKDANKHACQFYGWSHSIICSKRIFDLNSLSEDEIKKKMILAKKGNHNQFNFIHRLANGSLRDVEVFSGPIKINDRILLYSIVYDITERKLAEKELKDKTTLLSNLIVNLQEGILLEDAERKIVLTNQLFCDMFAISASPDVMIGADCSDSAEQSKAFFKNPDKFIADIKRILKARKPVFNDQLELQDGRFFERDYIPTFIHHKYNGHLWKYRDITESIESRKKLGKSEKRFSQVVEQSQEVVWEIDTDGLFTYVSPMAHKVYGYTSEQMTGKFHFYDLYPKKQRGEFKKIIFDKFSRKESIKNSVSNAIRNDGIEIVISTNGIPLFNNEGVFIGYRGIDIDITERVKAEKEILDLNANLELRIKQRTSQLAETNSSLIKEIEDRKRLDAALIDSEKNYRYIFENAQEGIFQTNVDGSYISVNQTLAKMYGFDSPEELMSIRTDISKDAYFDNTERNHFLKMMEEQGFVKGYEYEVKHKDGHKIWFYEDANAIKDENGKILYFEGFVIDITARKQAEEALRESEKSYRTVVENVNEIIFQTDSNGLWVFLNNSWEKITGFSVKESIGQLFVNYVHPDDRQRNMELFEPLISRKKDYCRHEIRYLTKDGGFKWIEVFARLGLNEKDEITGTYGTLRDITERKQVEEALLKSENLQRSLLENIAVGVIIIDPETRIIERANSFATSLMGDSMENIVGKICHQFICPAEVNSCPVCDNNQEVDNSERILIRSDKTQLNVLKTVKRIQIGDKEKLVESFVDITVQKEVEEALQQSSQKWEAIISASPDGIGMASLDGKLELLSEKLALMYGYSIEQKDQYLKKRIYDFIDPSNHDLLNENIRKLISGESNNKITEYMAVKKDNSRFYVDVNSTVLLDSNGKPKSILFVERDITERKQAEEALKQITTRLELATRAGGVGVWDYDIVNNVFLWDDQMFALYGVYDKKNANAYDVWQNGVHFEDVNRGNEEVQMAIRGEKEFDTEFRVIWPDCSVRNIKALATVLRDESGTPLRMIGTNWDITEQKKSEEKLIQQTKMQKVLMDMASGYINIPLNQVKFAIDKSLKDMGEFVAADRSYIFSYDFVKKITTNEYEWCNNGIEPQIDLLKDVPMQMISEWVKTHAQGNNLYIEDVDALPESELKNILEPQGIKSLLTVPMISGNECIGFVGFDSVKMKHKYDENEISLLELFSHMMVNVTNRAKAENELLEINANLESTTMKANEMAKLAEMANKAKSVFLANMSHEIRTPLNAIIGFSQLMNRDPLLTNNQKEYNFSIIRAGEHLLSLINDILELSKMEAGRLELNPTHVDLYALFADIQMIFEKPTQQKQLQFIFDVAENIPRFVFIDDNKLRRIFINLIGNAVKFTEIGGITVRIRIENKTVDTGILFVDVEDSGPGIPENELNKLFKHFEQTSSGIKKTSGTGLGLALSRELAILMGGNVIVKSEVDKGSIFTFTVEIKNGKPKAVKSNITKRVIGIENNQKPYRILVVDDKIENLQVAVRLLKHIGFETNEAYDGIDAIEKFGKWNPHLILMDLRMPVMDGYEATMRIKETEKGRNTPIIALTASVLKEEQDKITSLKMQGYIQKPFRENDLFNTIGNVLGIKYLYENENNTEEKENKYDSELIAKDISTIPDYLKFKILDAIAVADIELLIEHINEIDQNYIELTQYLITLAKNYDYNKIQELLLLVK